MMAHASRAGTDQKPPYFLLLASKTAGVIGLSHLGFQAHLCHSTSKWSWASQFPHLNFFTCQWRWQPWMSQDLVRDKYSALRTLNQRKTYQLVRLIMSLWLQAWLDPGIQRAFSSFSSAFFSIRIILCQFFSLQFKDHFCNFYVHRLLVHQT